MRLKNKRILSNSFTICFIKYLNGIESMKAKDIRELINMRNINKFNSVLISKKFRLHEYQLHIEEIIEIARATLFKPSKYKKEI